MPHPQFSSEEIARRGEEIYERDIRAAVEDEFDGKVIVIDIETGDYAIDESALPAADRLLARHAGAALYSTRIGYDAVYSFGGFVPRRTKG